MTKFRDFFPKKNYPIKKGSLLFFESKSEHSVEHGNIDKRTHLIQMRTAQEHSQELRAIRERGVQIENERYGMLETLYDKVNK